AFPPFRELLDACQDYAELSGCRFQNRAFTEAPASVTAQSLALQAAVQKAAHTVEEFTRRLLAKEEALNECVERAHRFVMAESVRAGIVATCREVGLWPPVPPPEGVLEDDYAFQDTTATLPVLAQRAYNDEARRNRDELLHPLIRRATTASFIVDFATESGLPPPTLSEQHHEMLEEFMSRVEEWVSRGAPANEKHLGGEGVSAAREALLRGLGGAEVARRQVTRRWNKNWETQGGAMLNVAAVGLAVLAGLATMKRASRAK
ncbi:unnamed protein product, partial [Polarella glacialis]